jgi:response regulator RpfG family c-di-GMP phosphodiesterase
MGQQQKRGDVIVVSADAGTRSALDSGLQDARYRVVCAGSAAEADVAARSASAEMAIIDSRMGPAIETMNRLRKINPALGCMVIISENDSALAVEAARAGAYDFFILPLDSSKAAFRLGVALEKHSRALEERAYTVALEERLNNRTEEVMAGRDRIKTQFINTIRALEKALQAKNVYTEGHSRRVAEKSVEIAKAMKVPREMIRHIELGALFHDIGKIGIRDDVLNKPSRLTESEYEHMKLHPIVAEQILSPIEELRPIVDIVKHEHERWDGGGYPAGLKGTAIPLGSRLIAITDAWDSMVFDRIYRKALPHDVALSEIEKNAGTQFDPDCVRIFVDIERARMRAAAPAVAP